jgi:hypothetical protein
MDYIRVNTGTKEKGRKQNTRPTVREQLQHVAPYAIACFFSI